MKKSRMKAGTSEQSLPVMTWNTDAPHRIKLHNFKKWSVLCFKCWGIISPRFSSLLKGEEEISLFVGPIGCWPYSCFFLLLLLLLLLQSLSRSSIKHQYFHDSSVGFNISYMVGKRTSPGFIWRWQRQRQRHTQRQIQGQRQSFQEESFPVYINLVLMRSNRYI